MSPLTTLLMYLCPLIRSQNTCIAFASGDLDMSARGPSFQLSSLAQKGRKLLPSSSLIFRISGRPPEKNRVVQVSSSAIIGVLAQKPARGLMIVEMLSQEYVYPEISVM